MPGRHILVVICIVALTMAACSAEERALPTVLDISAQNTPVPTGVTEAESESSQATPTDLIQRAAATLPPTYTPTASPTPFTTPTPTPLPPDYNPTGNLYYIYNSDTIMRLSGSSGEAQPIVHFGAGQIISDLAASPDGSMLAFIAPGSGSAREVWVTNPDGSWRQQVTCLGFADVRRTAWSWDSLTIGFLAGQSPGSPIDVYMAGWQGANDCPYGNRQRQMTQIGSNQLTDLAFSPDGQHLFFADNTIHAINLNTREIIPDLTRTIGFGGDFYLRFSPVEPPLLTYLQRTTRSSARAAGNLVALDVSSPINGAINVFTHSGTIEDIAWNHDGSQILISSADDVFLMDARTRIAREVIAESSSPPQAIFNPDSTRIAYINTDDTGRQQIYTSGLSSISQIEQISALEGGLISHLTWLER